MASHGRPLLDLGMHSRICCFALAIGSCQLSRAFPEADFRVVPDSGHSAYEVGTVHELISATDRFAGSR